MKIDTLGLTAFVAVADCGGFQKAADHLHLTQTALSRRLMNLESALGLRLIERTTRSVAPTETGRRFLPQARRLLADLEAALTEVRETGKARRGDVTIACVPTVGVQFLPAIIERYAALLPENRIRILDHSSAAVAEAVAGRAAEFGIHIASAHHPDLERTSLLTDHYVLACRTDHPLAARSRVAWRQLGQQRLIFAGESSSNRPVMEPALAEADIELHAFYEVQRSATALGLVAAGVGVAVVPRLALQQGAYPSIRVLPLVEPQISRRLVLIRRRNAQLSPAAQALWDLVVEHAAALGTRHRRRVPASGPRR